MTTSNFAPTRNNLYIRPDKEVAPVIEPVPTLLVPNTGKSPLISLSKTHREGTVIATGIGARNFDGTIIPMEVVVGDRVIYPYHEGAWAALDFDGETIHLTSEVNLLGIKK